MTEKGGYKMKKSPNIGLNIPEGNDIFNHETFLKENLETIDNYLTSATNNTLEFLKVNNRVTGVSSELETVESQLAQRATIKFHFLPVLPIAISSQPSGDSFLIVTKTGKTILIDTGQTDSYQLIKQFLIDKGVSKIDYLIISHYHSDHIGNLASLINDFNFSDCVAYIQKDSSFSQGLFNVHTEYTKVKNLLSGKIIVEPNNGDVITVDDASIKFFNCSQTDIDYYNANSTNYNDQSMCCEVTHRDIKVLYTGDIHINAQARIYSLGYFNKVDLLKVEHHGFDQDVNGDYIQTVHPDYSVTSSSISSYISTGIEGDYSSDVTNGGLKSASLSYLSGIGCKNYVLGYTGGISFTSDGAIIKPDDSVKPQKHSKMTPYRTIYVYVDKNTTVEHSDGTLFKPFRKIQEAYSFAGSIPNQRTRIMIANGDYKEQLVVSNSVGLEFRGNTSNDSDVKINSLTVHDSNVLFTSINVTGTQNIPVLFNGSTVQMDNCVVDGIPVNQTTYSDGRGVCAYNSNLYLNGCTVSNRSLAVGSYNGSNVSLNGLKGSNNDYVLGAITGTINSIDYTGTFNKAFLVKTYGNYTGDFSKGTTAQRLLSVDNNTILSRYFDTDLGKDFVWDGSKWIDSTSLVSNWTSVVFQNSATQWGTKPCQYRTLKEGGKTWVEFELSVQTIASLTTIFTLPVGFRPLYTHREIVTSNGGIPTILEIQSSGTMQILTPNANYPFDNTKYAIGNFRFRVD